MTVQQPYDLIIVALDDPRAYGRVLGPARALARAFGARLMLIRNAADLAPPPDPPITAAGTTTAGASALGHASAAELGGMTAVPFGAVGNQYPPGLTDPAANPVDPPQHMRNVEDTATTGDLNILANQLRDEGLVVESGEAVEDLAEAVLGAARLHAGALIVLAARHKGAIEQLFSSSASDNIIHEAPCAVLLVPGA